MLATDLSNPLGLDYSGLNYAETLQRDEQENQNKREYLNLKRASAKYTLYATLRKKLVSDDRYEKFSVPAYFDVAKDDVVEPKKPDGPYGPVRIVRTMKKTENAKNWNEESIRRTKTITNVIRQEMEVQEAVEEKKTVDEFVEFRLMFDDLRNINESLDISPEKVPFVSPKPCRRNQTYPQNLTELENCKRKMAVKRHAFNDKLGIVSEHLADGKNNFMLLKIMEETILEENVPVVSPSSSSCAVDSFYRYDFGLKTGLSDKRYQLEGFRNPIRTNLEPRSLEDEEVMLSKCITRNEWLAEMLPQRVRKIRRSRSIDRIDLVINHDNLAKENNQKKSFGEKIQKAADGERLPTIRKPHREEIASYFGVNEKTDPDPFDDAEAGNQLPTVRSRGEYEFLTNNLFESKNEITEKFKIRRHHIHRDHTKHKEAIILYEPKRTITISEPIDPIASAMKANSECSDDGGCDSSCCNKESYVEELTRRQDSIDACDSSGSSSICSNHTQDSGSEIYFDDIPMPLRLLTKSYDPYEESNRPGFKATRLQDRKESEKAYYRPPYIGQLQDMKKLMSQRIPKKVRLSRTALKSDNVPDIMLTYIYFPRRTNILKIIDHLREMSRLQFVATVYDSNANKLLHLRHELIERAMALKEKLLGVRDTTLLNRLNTAKQKTNDLEIKLDTLRAHCEAVKLSIVAQEINMRDRTVYKKLNYLIMSRQWRLMNDCLHTKANGSLECVNESIQNRYKTHMRTNLTEDAFDIKEFYEKRYPLSSTEANKGTFVDAKDFLQAMNRLTMEPIIFALYSICQLNEEIAAKNAQDTDGEH